MKTQKLIEDLNYIISNGIEAVSLPYVKGKSIRIKNYIIRENSKGFNIYDCENNKPVAKTFFKTSALAIVKNLIENKNITQEALELDKELLKHYNDILYFKNKIKSSNSAMVKESRQARMSVSMDRTKYLKEKLDDFIF